MFSKKMRLLFCLILLTGLFQTIPGGNTAALSPSVRVSVASNGAEANGDSHWPSISADGRYVAFASDAANLVSGDSNATADIFVHDRITGATERVSVNSSEQQANGGSERPSISGDGRHVAFLSSATNLVDDDTNNVDDVFVRDRQTGTTVRVSVSSVGEQANDNCDNDLAISGNGRYVAFHCSATNLTDGDNNLVADLFVHDLQTGETERVNVSSAEAEANSTSWSPSISEDGNFVSFESGATNLVDADTNSRFDVFVRDRQTGATTRVSVNSNGEEADHGGGEPSISASGRYVVFSSVSDNLMSDDNYGFTQVFIHDRQTGQTSLVSSYEDYGPMVGWSEVPKVSSDGRYVVFEYDDKGDGLPGRTIYLHDCFTGASTGIAPGYDETDSSYSPDISSDGRFAVFSSNSNYIVPNDSNHASDVFEREIFTPVVKTYISTAAYDGWIIESSENNESGGHVDSASTTLYVGDATSDQQYRALLHFDTGSLPNNAVITQAVLKLKRQGLTGGNPFNSLGELQVDVRKSSFGAIALEAADFESAADLNAATTVGSGLSGGWYTATLDPSVFSSINLFGSTQFRLRFAQGDNDNQSADFLKLFSGDASTGDQPYLYLEYYVPLEKYPRVLSILRASPNPTDASTVAYSVIFNEAVTGVDATDFALTTSGVTNASVLQVSGADDTWSVLVDTGDTPGTLRLNVVDDDSIRNARNQRLGGYDPGNGDFTSGEVYTLLDHPTFGDVPFNYWAWPYIQSVYLAGITGGCGNSNYCPNDSVTRAQMAVFLERGMNGSTYTPPPATGTVFGDIPADYWSAAWIEQLSADGVTGGCGNGNYCPEIAVTRDQMAVFLLRAEHGTSYTPPEVGADTGFSDVPNDYWSAAWIKQLAAEGITGGCGGGKYCPSTAVTRAQMAVFLQATFNLALP